MFLPPDERQPGYPPSPDVRPPKRSEAAFLWLLGMFLLSVLLGPIGGSTLGQALVAVLGR